MARTAKAIDAVTEDGVVDPAIVLKRIREEVYGIYE